MAFVSRKILAVLTVFVAAACTISVSAAAQEKPSERSGDRSGDAKSAAPQTTAAPDSITEGSVTIGGQPVAYRAVAGTITVGAITRYC